MRPQAEFDAVQRLIACGLNDCQISRATGIPRTTIVNWRHMGTRPERGRYRPNDCPICGESQLDVSAYAYLLGIYLGDGYITQMPRVYKLRVTLDLRYPGIIEETASAMTAMRPDVAMAIGRVHHIGCLEVTSHWKHWPCLFPQHGPGPKHLRPIQLQSWQQEIVENYPDRLLRGLIHSDGWRGLNRVKGYAYPRYQFTNASEDIRAIFCKACDDFGVRWRRMNARNISIARREDVAKLDTVVGPKR